MLTLPSLDERIKSLKQELIKKREALENKTDVLELRPLRKRLKRSQRRRRALLARTNRAAGVQNEKKAKRASSTPAQTAGGEASVKAE